MIQQVQQDQTYYQQVHPSPFVSSPSPSTVYQLPPGLSVPSSSASMASTSRVPQVSNQGHRVQTVQQAQGNNFGWVLTYVHEHFVPHHHAAWDVNKFMLVDSGASLHVCPPHFAAQFPVRPHPNPPVIRGVNNKVLQILGIKTA
jgi:hypothetical protein